MPSRDLGGSDSTWTASPWGIQESGVGGLWVDAQAGRRHGRKSPSATTDKAGMRGCNWARQGQGRKYGGRRELEGAEPSGVRRDYGGREASGVDPDPHRVGGEEGGREASGVTENPRGGSHGVGGGVMFYQGNLTPRVAKGPRANETPGALTASKNRRGEDGGGRGRGE